MAQCFHLVSRLRTRISLLTRSTINKFLTFLLVIIMGWCQQWHMHGGVDIMSGWFMRVRGTWGIILWETSRFLLAYTDFTHIFWWWLMWLMFIIITDDMIKKGLHGWEHRLLFCQTYVVWRDFDLVGSVHILAFVCGANVTSGRYQLSLVSLSLVYTCMARLITKHGPNH